MGLSLTPAKKRVLKALAGSPKHGYALAKELGVRGSTVYDHLSDLESHDYLTSRKEGRRRVYELTEKGDLIIQAEGSGDD